MLTENDWLRLTDPATPWQQRYSEIAAAVKETLATVPPDQAISVRQLVTRLYPVPHGPAGATALKRLYGILRKPALHLDGWFTVVPRRNMYGKMVQAMAWHNTEETTVEPSLPDAVPDLGAVRYLVAKYLDQNKVPDEWASLLALFLDLSEPKENNTNGESHYCPTP